MNNLIRILVVFLGLTSIVSCKKSTDEFVPYPDSDFNDVEWNASGMSNARRNDMLKGLAKPIISFTFNTNGTIKSNITNNTVLSLPSNAYTLNGVNYNGDVIANLDELKTKGDFIRQLIPNCSSDNILEFKGAFNLSLLSSNKNNLAITNPNKIDLYFNNGYSIDFFHKYYTGNFANNIFSWNVADASLGVLKSDNVNNKQHDQIETNKLGWMSINKSIADNFITNGFGYCTVVTPTNFTNKNTLVFVALKSYRTVLQMKFDANNKTFFDANLPINETATFIAISYLDGKFYLGSADVIISKDMNVSIKTPTTPALLKDINELLDKL